MDFLKKYGISVAAFLAGNVSGWMGRGAWQSHKAKKAAQPKTEAKAESKPNP